ncbi:hypothetical protein DP43_2277 [Burkholderia pseudomallei]|nr:hypothetical protein DP43_2277 [Burkholderia pseudomallei]
MRVQLRKQLAEMSSLIVGPMAGFRQQVGDIALKHLSQLDQTSNRRHDDAALDARNRFIPDPELLSYVLLRQLALLPTPSNRLADPPGEPRFFRIPHVRSHST